MSSNHKLLFHEVQNFRANWVFPAVIISAALSISGIVILGALEEASTKVLLLLLAVFIPLNAFLLWLMYSARLEIEVREEGVYYRWAPIFNKPFLIPAGNIAKAEIRRGPFLQYGFHIFPTYGRVHNVSGKQGLQFRLNSGRKIFLGTQEPYLFKKAVDSIIARKLKSARSES